MPLHPINFRDLPTWLRRESRTKDDCVGDFFTKYSAGFLNENDRKINVTDTNCQASLNCCNWLIYLSTINCNSLEAFDNLSHWLCGNFCSRKLTYIDIENLKMTRMRLFLYYKSICNVKLRWQLGISSMTVDNIGIITVLHNTVVLSLMYVKQGYPSHRLHGWKYMISKHKFSEALHETDTNTI